MHLRDRLVFDVETNGFYDDADTLHSLVIKDPDTGEMWSCTDHEYSPEDSQYANTKVVSVEEGLGILKTAKEIIGHNIVKFDIPILRKLYGWKMAEGQEPVDTMILSELIFTDFGPWDSKLMRENRLPGKMFGRHSLEAWGYRLTNFKGDYKDDPSHMLNALREAGGTIAEDRSGRTITVNLGDKTYRIHKFNSWAEGRTKVLKRAFNDQGIQVNPFEKWSPEMQQYCETDVMVTSTLWDFIKDKEVSFRSHELEHDAHRVCEHIERCGFKFKVQEAEKLYGVLATERSKLAEELIETFGSWWAPSGDPVRPKKRRRMKMQGFPNVRIKRISKKTGKELKPYIGPPLAEYSPDAPYTPIEYVTFSPSSRDDIAARLTKLYGWRPTEFTANGKPVVDDDTLKSLEHIPEAAKLARFFMLEKRIGQLAEGKQGWLGLLKDGSFIKGEYNVNKAVTGRATHNRPNISQVPTADEKVPFGAEFRDLFTVPEGWGLDGSDLSGLELRCLGHYLKKFDGGAYLEEVLSGDPHWKNALALGLVPAGTEFNPDDPWHLTARNKIAKRFIYAFLYGAGDEKIGVIYTEYVDLTDEQIKRLSRNKRARWLAKRTRKKPTDYDVATIAIGGKLKERFLNANPALKKLRDTIEHILTVRKKRDGRMWLEALDGRELHVRSIHSALNTLLQSAGAILCKKWITMTFDALCAEGLRPAYGTNGKTYVTEDGDEADFAFCAWSHDELQIGFRTEEIKNVIEKTVKASAKKAGEFFDFASPLEAEATSGPTWRYTH